MGKHGVATRERSIGDVDPVADRLLVERSQAGDRDAFAELYAWYSGRLVRYCREHLGDPGDAEDAAQESFVRAWRALGSLTGDRRFYPWLRVIAHNVCMDWNRRRRTEPFEGERLNRLTAPIVAEDELALAAMDGELVLEALRNLSPRHREVLELREQLSWTYQRIADHEGVAVSTIETLLFRARRALRKEFMALTGGDGAAALLFARVRRGLARLIGLHGPTVANATDAPVVAVRLGTMGAVVAAATIASVVAIGPSQHRGPQSPRYPAPAEAVQGRAHASSASGAAGTSRESMAGPSAPGGGLSRHPRAGVSSTPVPTVRQPGSPAGVATGGRTSSSTGSSSGAGSSSAGTGPTSGTTGAAAAGIAGASSAIGSSSDAERVIAAAGQASSGSTSALGSAVGDIGNGVSAASQQVGAAAGSALQAAAAALGDVAGTLNQVLGAVSGVANGKITGSPTAVGGTSSGGTSSTPGPSAGGASGTGAATVTSTVAATASTVATAVNNAASTVSGATSDAGSAAGSAASTVGDAAATTVTTLVQAVAGLLGH